MPIVLSDVIASDDEISSRLRGKNMRLNNRIAKNGGHVDINMVWTQTLRQFEIAFVAMTKAAWDRIQALHEVTEGGAYGFLIEDPKDSKVDAGVLSLVSGSVYQLHKRYVESSSSRYKDRTITRPNPDTFRLFNLGVEVMSYTLDEETGRVTIPGAPAAANLEWSGRFYVPVHFMDDFIDWEVARPGSDETLLLEGPSIMLMEIRE